MREAITLLGKDHGAFGALTLHAQAGGRTAAAISVGSAAPDGVRIFKGDLEVPNEDAALVVDDGPRTLLAVCDGHHGHAASHFLIEALAAHPLPRDPLALLGLLTRLAAEPDLEAEAQTTLLIGVVDRERGGGFAVSFGDSSLFVVGAGEPPKQVNRKNRSYTTPWLPGALNPRRAEEFSFPVVPGQLMVAFTDGIDECHYGRPATSLGPTHLWNLLMDTAGVPADFVRAVAELALAGVGGNPGGQDNLAIAATRV